jgi:hypothetical protein
MPRQHGWTERDDNDGKREVRATWFGREWRLQSKRAEDESWTYHEHPLLEDLMALKELLERKYRRRRATTDELRAVEKLMKQYDE